MDRWLDLHLRLVEALALAIDAKEHTAHNHVSRVLIYATALARALDMSEDEVQAVKLAALLHDIGKLAVPEQILSKPGPLTPEEFQKIRLHPQVGADIIAGIPFPSPVAPLILSHHERWDGRGYPSGLRGEEIPLGARILCLVDYFDALTSSRPYHKPMSIEVAVGMIEKEAGKALDPTVVATLIRILPEVRIEAEKADLSRRGVAPAIAPSEDSPIISSPRLPEKSTNVFEHIALAHREIYALYEIAQTMGTSLGVPDTMTHIASKLSGLVPFSTCALFLYADNGEMLYCRFASGTDSELIQKLALRNGTGLSGWVARNRRPLVNARPTVDLEAGGSNLLTSLQSALVCPLIYSDRLIGTLVVYHTSAGFYRDDHRRLLDRVCEQAAAVIHNAIVFEQTQESSLTDPCTGLPNLAFLRLHLSRELHRAERLQSNVALAVVELVGLSALVQSFGADEAEVVIKQAAHGLRSAMRPHDVAVKLGGDEFVIVLVGCGRAEAEACAVHWASVITPRMNDRINDTFSIHIRVGLAVFPYDGDSFERLLSNAIKDSRVIILASSPRPTPSL